MKSINEIVRGLSPELEHYAGSIPPPSVPAAATSRSNDLEPLAETIKRHCIRICEENHKVFSPDRQTLLLIEKLAEYLQGNRFNWLVIYGPLGMGKTLVLHAAKAALKERNANRIPDLFTANQIREYAAKGDPAFTWICEDLKFVAIDDIGSEVQVPKGQDSVSTYGTARSPLKTVLEERYARNLRTIITTNDDISTLAQKYGGRVADRISQKDYVATIVLSGESFRQKPGAERIRTR